MSKSFKITVFLSLILIGLLLIPLDGRIENTFLFFLGRFHPILLHLPIGGLIALFVMEIVNGYRPKLNLDSGCKILLWFSIITIIPTTILGFFLASNASYDDELLNIHKWLGLLTAFTCIWLYFLRNRDNKKSIKQYRYVLYSNVIFLSLAGHFGGMLTHGEDYLTKYMPEGMKNVFNIDQEENYLVVERKTDPSSIELTYYTNEVQPVIENYCYKCHGEEKQKGEMRFDNLDWDMVNGFDGEKWNLMLNEINLGEMPPDDQDQLSNEERKILVDWISKNLEIATTAKQKNNKTVMRRLTKSQYTNSLNQLLGVNINFGDVLPNDGKSKMGFTNNGNILQTSSLHIDYYQKLAREALDKAIVRGEKPESKRYKVILGKDKGDGVSGAEFGGYQTAPLNNKDFIVQILHNSDSIQKTKNKIGIGMRGSASNRYYVVDEGMILNSALPAKEVTPKSWQGPSPNLKLLIKQDFPREGRYAFRIEASKGYNSLSVERLIDLRKKDLLMDLTNAVTIHAKNLKENEKFILKDNKWLMPKEFASWSEIEFSYYIPKDGIYKIDLIHPYVNSEVMPSYRVSLFGGKEHGIVSKRLDIMKKTNNNEITTPVTLAYFSKGEHKGFIGGKFFVGFSKLVFTPISDDDPLPKILEEELKNNSNYLNVNPSILAFAGSRTDDGMDYKALDKPVEVEVPYGESKLFEFTGMLENLPIPMSDGDVSGELANILTFGLWNNYLVKESNLKGPPLLIKSVEFEAPYFPVWPPDTHARIFFESPTKNNNQLYAREVIENFMIKAFRRPLNPGELDRYMQFWINIKNDFKHFDEGVKEVLIAVLCSPNFIYLNQPIDYNDIDSQDEFYLASQLSYFLWNSPPDEKLVELASKGKLYNNLSKQIDRMIESPKIKNFINGFSYEWLRLDRHKNMDVNVNIEKYVDYTRFVKEDMFNETYEFMKYVLKNDLSILSFIDSDFAMLNQNLAEFYGVNGVLGNEFRAVKIKKEQNRGGLLSQGSFLTGHSDGVQPHAIKRAVWLKEKILGDHPPPPPPNVPELDPETPGFENLTLKEQLFLHRNKASCIGCHQKIDPYGVVFENYDATGRYQIVLKGKLIDSRSVLPDGKEVEGIQGIKDYILNFKTDDFTTSIVSNIFAYANGRDIGFADEKEINYIVNQVKKNKYSFRTLIKEIIYSPTFYKTNKNWLSKLFALK